MSFRFRERIQIAPGLAINLSKGWPSLSIGGEGATVNVGRRGPRPTLGGPGTGLSWQLGGHRHVHKAVQAQADIRAVHAQGTAKAVRAQEEMIAITKRMETVAKRLTRNAAGSMYWKKAALEQAQLLDEMLDVAKESENDQLIAAVYKCQNAWGDGHPNFRGALDSGMTIAEYVAMVLAGGQPVKGASGNLNLPVTPSRNVDRPAVNVSSANRESLAAERKHVQFSTDEPPFWPALPKTLGRGLVPFLIGCGVIVIVYTITARKATVPTQVIFSATPMPQASISVVPQAPISMPPPQTPAAAPISEPSAATTPTPQAITPLVQTSQSPPQREPVIHGKANRKKHATHD